MQNSKTVKDCMIDVFKYPHIPYWFSIRQAMGIIKKSFMEDAPGIHPRAILVFDEKYNLMGSITIREIVIGLAPEYLPRDIEAQVINVGEELLARVWASLFTDEIKKHAEKPVSEIMVPAKFFVSPDDPISKPVFMMIHHNLYILPVLENQQKLVGLVRLQEVFEEIYSIVL